MDKSIYPKGFPDVGKKIVIEFPHNRGSEDPVESLVLHRRRYTNIRFSIFAYFGAEICEFVYYPATQEWLYRNEEKVEIK